MNQSKPLTRGAQCSTFGGRAPDECRNEWAHLARIFRCVLGGVFASALVACGGGATDTDVGSSRKTQSVSQTGPGQGRSVPAVDQKTQALMQDGARLNTAELEAIAKTGVLPKSFEGASLSGAAGSTKATLDTTPEAGAETKSAASRTEVYRFFNTQTSAHFFTTSVSERNNVQATLPHMTYEGPAFYASGSTVPGLSPVHRFYNTGTGVHFYTISETERAHVVATLPLFTYEGIAYYASTLPGSGYTPLYRFYYAVRGFHFYTNSLTERDNIIATLPQYNYEGVGYYVLGSDWQTPAVPHTGITNSQCYQTGSDALADCDDAGAIALNRQQDGHRTDIQPMRYSQIISGYAGTFPFSVPLYYPKTACVRDDVTGLIWEGKTNTFTLHNGLITFTNYGDGRSSDVSNLVNDANEHALCGFNDWRLPSVEELHGIVDNGVTSGPRIRLSDLPNTPENHFWSSDTYAGFAGGTWLASFSGTADDATTGDFRAPARLVRGTAWSGTRHLVTSASYLTDGANNAVVDRKTGLTWRRCLEGQFWTGSACIGTATVFNHQNALREAEDLNGWRLPNIKELASLADRSRQIPAMDPTAFPGQGGGRDTWSSTPVSDSPGDAEYIAFSNGYRGTFSRGSGGVVQLVQDNP